MKSRRNYRKKIRTYAVILAALIVTQFASIHIVKHFLLNNLAHTQTAIASSAAASLMYENTNSIGAYQAVLTYAANQIDVRVIQHDSEEQIVAEGLTYIETLNKMFGIDAVSALIMYNQQLYPENDTVWIEKYRESIADSDENHLNSVIFTDVYQDPVSDKPVITVATRCKDADAVLALKIDVETLIFNGISLIVPQNSDYYLCDSNGTLISAHISSDHEGTVSAQKFLDDNFENIRTGKFDNSSCSESYLKQHIGIYYTVLPNGWYSIVSTSHKAVIDRCNIICLIFSLCILLLIFIGIRDIRLTKKALRSDETLNVLVNLYFAIYCIDFEKQTYEIVKGSDYANTNLSKTGSYDHFIDTMINVIYPEDREIFKSSLSCDSIRKLTENNIRNYGEDFRRISGNSQRWTNVRVLFGESIEENEVLLVFKDCETEKQRALNEIKLLENALETAKHSEKTRQDFFKNMSHDMRTPLNAIIGLSSIAADNIGDNERTLDYLNNIKKSGQTLLELINEILDMSRIQNGKLRLNYHSINICDCINDCAAAFYAQARLERKNFKVRFKVKHKTVMGDEHRICQIVNALLSNAFKFTVSEDSISVTVTEIKCENFSEYVIVIADTGIGMSEQFLTHLFEPYTRETTFYANHVEGTGLGLAIAKNIVTQMNGEITVDSTLHKGSTFTVTLPFAAADEQVDNPILPEKDDISLEGRKILLAEDNILNMEVASEILKMNGMLVTEAWNGEEAVKYFEDSELFFFDAVLMDMQMPKMDGCEAARRIRQMSRPDAENTPIIALTANAFSEDIIATSSAGMDAHISKPIETKLLCETLKKYIKIQER